MRVPFVLVVLLSAGLAAAPASAKGCLKGAVVGGAAGHYAGHHGVIGAAAALREQTGTSLPRFAAVRPRGPNLLLGLRGSDQTRRVVAR